MASLYVYPEKEDGVITLNADHVQQVMDGKAGIAEVTSHLGVFRQFFKEEFTKLRLGRGVANRKVIYVKIPTKNWVPLQLNTSYK